jgi:hypothetical protein
MVLSSSLLPAHQQPKTKSLGVTIVKRKKASTICNIESTRKLKEKNGANSRMQEELLGW